MGLLSFLFGGGGSHSAPRTQPSLVVLGTRTVSGRTVTRIQRSPHLYPEKGWHLAGDVLKGYYRTRHGSFEGRIENPSGAPCFFIFKPPGELLNGPHAPCFKETSKNLYRIHWSREPENVDAGILKIEHDIMEALSCPRSDDYGAF